MQNALTRHRGVNASAIAGLLLLAVACQPAPAAPPPAAAPTSPAKAAAPTAQPTVAPAKPTAATAAPTAGATAAPTAGTTAPTPAAKAAAETPRRGGILKVVTANDPASFDLHQEASILALQAIAPAYNGLVTIDSQSGKIVGDLAETFEVSPD
ncbi:MAG: hypothetical protein HY718_02780, partial [Planctomycetes bacterium]|nr:hypothetical protein [Planctomycetota bacterium]